MLQITVAQIVSRRCFAFCQGAVIFAAKVFEGEDMTSANAELV